MGLGLNLEGADLSGFDPLPSGQYYAAVFEASIEATKGGEDAKLPKDTPMINVQWKVFGRVGEDEQGEESPYFNRRQFSRFIIAPSGYEKKKVMDGLLARFLIAIGYSEEEVTSNNFDPDLEDFVGREAIITVGQYEYEGETRNRVRGVKPPMVAESGSGLL